MHLQMMGTIIGSEVKQIGASKSAIPRPLSHLKSFFKKIVVFFGRNNKKERTTTAIHVLRIHL